MGSSPPPGDRHTGVMSARSPGPLLAGGRDLPSVPFISGRAVGLRPRSAERTASVDMEIALICFPMIFLAELPDKTMFANLVMATKGRPLQVWLGAAGAFVVHVAIAMTGGPAAPGPNPPARRS